MSRRALGQRVAPPPQPWSHWRRRSRDPPLPRSLLLSSPPPFESTQVTRPARRGRSPRRAACTHRDFLAPGLARVSPGGVPGGRDAEARLELPGRGEVRRRGSPPPPPPRSLPPAPPPRAPAAQRSARRRVRHKQTRLGRTWTAELLHLPTDLGLRAPRLQAQGNASRGRRARPGPAAPAVSAPAPLPAAPAPWLRGRRRPCRPPARRGLGAAGTETRSRTKQHSRLLAAPSPSPTESRGVGGKQAGRKSEKKRVGSRGSGRRGTVQPGGGCARGGVAGSQGAPGRRLRRGVPVPQAGPAHLPGSRYPLPRTPPLRPERGSAGLEHVWV